VVLARRFAWRCRHGRFSTAICVGLRGIEHRDRIGRRDRVLMGISRGTKIGIQLRIPRIVLLRDTFQAEKTGYLSLLSVNERRKKNTHSGVSPQFGLYVGCTIVPQDQSSAVFLRDNGRTREKNKIPILPLNFPHFDEGCFWIAGGKVDGK
jgi:hypothetical protein